MVLVWRMPSSENPSGADNQQERLLTNDWVVGFVDGEGCFSCPIFRNGSMTLGWQVQPSFVVVQGVSSRSVLDAMVPFFGCGRLSINRRYDNHREHLYRYYVSRFRDLRDVIVPFFEDHRLVVKADDFRSFASIVRAMRRKEHLTRDGFERLLRLAYGMNAEGKQRSRDIARILAGSSETARWAPERQGITAHRVKIQSDPHGDMGSQAEMT